MVNRINSNVWVPSFTTQPNINQAAGIKRQAKLLPDKTKTRRSMREPVLIFKF